MDSEAILTKAREVLAIEIEGLEAIKNTLNGDFVKLVEACCQTLDSGAKIVISGIGKSGHIGSKIAATSLLAIKKHILGTAPIVQK